MAKELRTVNQRYGALRTGIVARLDRLKRGLVVAEDYETNAEAVVDSLKDLEADRDMSEAPGGLPETCKEQRAKLENVRERIGALGARLEQIVALTVELRQQAAPDDVDALNLRVSETKRRAKEVQSSADKRQAELDHALETAEEFQTGVGETFAWLGVLEEKISAADPVASEVQHVREQLERHREFQHLLGPRQADVDGINDEGIAIVKVCLGRDRPKINDQLAEINRRWAALCHDSVQRQQRLEEALLASGQYQAAFDGLLEWVVGAEKTLSEAEPTTGDVERLKLLLGKHKVKKLSLIYVFIITYILDFCKNCSRTPTDVRIRHKSRHSSRLAQQP